MVLFRAYNYKDTDDWCFNIDNKYHIHVSLFLEMVPESHKDSNSAVGYVGVTTEQL